MEDEQTFTFTNDFSLLLIVIVLFKEWILLSCKWVDDSVEKGAWRCIIQLVIL